MDPLTEMDKAWSSFTYVNNNPVRNIDPTGMSTEDFLKEHGLTKDDLENVFKSDDDDEQNNAHIITN